VLGRADQPGQLDQHPDERLAREGPQPTRHHRCMAPPLRDLQPRHAVVVLETDVAARPRQSLRTLRMVVLAGAVEGREAVARLHGVHRRAPRQQQPQQLQLTIPRRGHQRGHAVAARAARVRAIVQQQPRHLYPAERRGRT
jgi:hypothetical protein